MKVRPNAPCPCGSGRKYKKCCLPKDTQAANEPTEGPWEGTHPHHAQQGPPGPPTSPPADVSASYDSLQALPAIPRAWPPLQHDRLPSDLNTPEAFAKWLSPQQLVYLGTISNLVEQQGHDSAEEALAMFDAIPRKDQQILFPLMLKPGILKLLGREEDAYRYCFDLLCEIQQEQRWIESGGLVWEWLLCTQHHDNRAYVLEGLRQVCQRDGFAPTQLLLAQLLLQTPQSSREEVTALHRASLLPERWRSYTSPNPTDPPSALIRPWLSQLAHGLYAFVEVVYERDPDETSRYTRQLMGLPWEQLPPTEQTAFESLCLSLLRHAHHKEIRQLCDRLQRKWPPTGRIAFWQGYVAYQFGKVKQSLDAFEKAQQYGQLERYHLLNMLPILLSQEQLDASRQLLDQLSQPLAPHEPSATPSREMPEAIARAEPDKAAKNPDATAPSSAPEEADAPRVDVPLDVMKIEIEYCRLTHEPERGLRFCERVLALDPDYPPARFHQAVWYDELGDGAHALAALEPLLDHERRETRAFAALLSMGLAIEQGEYDVAAQRLHELLPKEEAFAIFQEHEWRRTFLLNWGMILEQLHPEDPQALELFKEALRYPPKEPIYGHILDHLCEKKRFDEARELGLQAIADCPDAPRLKFAMCQIEDLFGHWEASLGYIDTIGFDWFLQEGRVTEGIYLKIRSLLGCQKPRMALHFCEQWLEEILADETLKALRAQVLKEVDALIQALEDKIGAQDLQYQQLEDTQRLLTKQREENRRRERAYQEILKRHEGLRETIGRMAASQSPKAGFSHGLQSHQTAAEATSLPPRLQQLADQLSTTQQQIFQSAQHLWQGLASHPEQDHGPVVLQLARVVEGKINQLLIDPLCQWTLAQDHPLSELPRPSLHALKPSGNRLSLGDAASLLYHQLQLHEPDGSTSTITNPRSSPAHAALLTGFWDHIDVSEELRSYLRQELPQSLRILAKARNRAGHAHKPIPRDEASKLRFLVLGDDTTAGILPQLLAVGF